MLRPMIVFDYEKCTGCAKCAKGCGKQVIEMQEGRPVIPEDRLCDGLGVCIPLCKFEAISVQELDVDPFDPQAVREYRKRKKNL